MPLPDPTNPVHPPGFGARQQALHTPQDYYRRYKVCLKHASSPMVMLRGIPQRFCQQCGTFHPIGEFDADKRCCSVGAFALPARSHSALSPDPCPDPPN